MENSKLYQRAYELIEQIEDDDIASELEDLLVDIENYQTDLLDKIEYYEDDEKYSNWSKGLGWRIK